MAAPMLAAPARQEGALVGGLVMAGVWVSVFLSVLVPFDFRGDIDRMGTLKTLPVVPWRLALGQVLAPALILTLVLWAALAALALAVAEQRLFLSLCMAYAPAFTFYLVAMDNLLFLFFPVRVQASTPGDFQAIGRNVLLSVCKILSLAVPGMAIGVGALAAFLLDASWLWVAVAAPLTLAAGGLAVALAGVAFGWYDVGRDTPA